MVRVRGTYDPLPEAGYPYSISEYPSWRCLIVERGRGPDASYMRLVCGAEVLFTPAQSDGLAFCYSAPCPRCSPDPVIDGSVIMCDPGFTGYYHQGPHSGRSQCCRYPTARAAWEAWQSALQNPSMVYDMVASWWEPATEPQAPR